MVNLSRYRGNRRLSSIYPDNPAESRVVRVQLCDPKSAGLFLRIMEGYAHLAFVVALDPREGLYAIHTTQDRWDEVLRVLPTLPTPLTVSLETTSEM